MAEDQITVLGETFETVVGKTVGEDYISHGNVRWPADQNELESARDFYSVAVPSRDDVESHRPTTADYEFARRKGFILGPPQNNEQGTREDWIKRRCVGVYREKSADWI